MTVPSLSVDIEPSRQINFGQPSSEKIYVETYLLWPRMFPHVICETKRFGDYLRRGGSEVRYYHLLQLPFGAVLSLSPDPKGSSRLIQNIYFNRKFCLGNNYIPPNVDGTLCLVLNSCISPPFTHCRVSSPGEYDIVFTINCVEYFNKTVRLLGSCRMPDILLPKNGYQLTECLLPPSMNLGSPHYNLLSVTPGWVDINITLEIDNHELFHNDGCFYGSVLVEAPALSYQASRQQVKCFFF